MTLPNFLCIGAQKAGTTWLYTQLMSHPDVWMPPVKELQYFNHLYVPQHRSWTTWHIRRGAARALAQHVTASKKPDFDYVRYLADLGSRDVFTDAWYRAAFAQPAAQGKVLGDITPDYSTVPEAGIRHVRALLGPVKIIYILRAPVSRALSQLRMNAARKRQEMSEGQWHEMADQWEIAHRGDYRAYVLRWKAHFAPEDILFLPYGRIEADPQGLLREVEAFLGIGGHDYPRIADRVHAGKKIEVPQAVVRRLEARLEAQQAFIAAEFGADFVHLT